MSPAIKKWLLHSGLFVLTFFTATLFQGPVYAVAIMTILLAHELGHFFACRRYAVPATFPIFIPMLNILGTLGAVIAIKGQIPHRKGLFDIGVAGPLVGLFFGIPAIFLGLLFSDVIPTPTNGPQILLGEPLLFQAIVWIVKGPIPENMSVFLHPLAFAGWASLLVTSINLIPAGQLDGGHMVYAMFGPRKARLLSWLMIFILLIMGFLFHKMWLLFSLLVFFLARKHPSPMDDQTPLDHRRFQLGLFTYLLMILCFSPIPLEFKNLGG